MVIVDGRTDREKLLELLQSPEQTHLEFKEKLDLNDNESQLNFVKDAVSMTNRPPGGYILIGVADDGSLTMPAGTITDRARFDGARLGDAIRKYIDGEVHAISQIHQLDQHEVVLIFFPGNRDGLPIPMSKMGQFLGQNKRQIVVFREGDVLIREGAKNAPLRHAHWNDLLAHRDQRIRNEARADIDSLLRDLAAALRPGGAPLVPLTVESGNAAFSESVISHLEANSELRLQQFLGKAGSMVLRPETRHAALDKISILGAQSMYFGREGMAQQVVETLYKAYIKLGAGDNLGRLDIITRIYVLGSLAVRLHHWGLVHSMVIRPYRVMGSYVYSSWIRHGQVESSRAGLFPEGKGGLMISAARDLYNGLSEARPDDPSPTEQNTGNLPEDDPLFNSLCQFDILYCLVVTAESREEGGAYPAASAMNQRRADPAFELVAEDEAARKALFPTSDERNVSRAMLEVFDLAKRESFKSAGSWWSSLPYAAESFIVRHPPGGA